jgi:signal transduction histidine kinase/CHASE2 domain-containing sensor protein
MKMSFFSPLRQRLSLRRATSLLRKQEHASETFERRLRATRGMAQGLAVALLALLLLPSLGPIRGLGNHVLDSWFALRGLSPREALPASNVAVLGIDAATRRRWNGRVFDARDMSRVLALLKQNGARAIALAVPNYQDGFLSRADSALFAQAVKKSGITHLPLSTQAGRQATQPVTSSGYISMLVDADGHVRRSPLLVQDGQRFRPSLALSVVTQVLDTPFSAIVHAGKKNDAKSWDQSRVLLLRGREIALEPGGVILLNYLPSAPDLADSKSLHSAAITSGAQSSPAPSIPFLSLAAALQNPAALRAWNGRCVVIGVTDLAAAPQWTLSSGARVPETTVHAIALENLLSGNVLETASSWRLWILTTVLCITVGGMVAARPPMWSGVVTLLAMMATAFFSFGLFLQDVWLDVSVAWIAMAATFLQGVVTRARLQEREATRVASTVEALERAGEIVSTQANPEDLLRMVLEWASSVMEAEGASALIAAEHGAFTVATTTGMGTRGLELLSAAARDEIAERVVQTGKPILVQDARQDLRFRYVRQRYAGIEYSLRGLRRGLTATSVICAPLRSGEELLQPSQNNQDFTDNDAAKKRAIGVIMIVNRRDHTPFSRGDLKLLTAVTDQASVALDNTRLYEILNQRVARSESDLEQTNQRLESEKNTLQTVLESMTDGVVVTDTQGRIQMMNPAARALLPELSDSSLHCPLAQCLPDVASALASSLLAEGGIEGKSDEQTLAEKPNLRKSHVVRGTGALLTSVQLQRGDPDVPQFIEARSAPLLGVEGDTIGIVSVFADVTEELGIEQAKSDFVSFVAHEMRSPLTSISGFSSMLQRMDKNESSTQQRTLANEAARARFLTVIHNESERLTRLINNLLDVARIEAGHGIELNREAIEFASIAHEAIESQRVYSSRHRLVNSVPPDLPRVYADRDKVLQILINLLSNAMKYSPGGLVTVEARVEEDFLRVSVSDQGPGIAPEQSAHLFQRFGRLGPRNTGARNPGAGERAKPTGTGLGLFLTRHLVDSHEGRIWVESQPGQGAKFIFTLHLAQS